MLCPEVSNFPSPKVISFQKHFKDVESVHHAIKMNNFYKSIIITCPDELHVPSTIQEAITDDSDFYKITCGIAEFVEPTFIENFVKNGSIYCSSLTKNCIVSNSAAITPDGILTIHIPDYVFQTMGLEGTKRPHNFYEIRLDLKTLKHTDKVKNSLSKLEVIDFFISWEPNNEDVCPSSIAKYFYDRDITVSVSSQQIRHINPTISEVPSIEDTEVVDMSEWIGMLAHEVDLTPTEPFISSYCQPESEKSLRTSRIALLHVKGFITPSLIRKVIECLSSYASSRELDNYWVSLSVQSYENSLWQWSMSCPKMFQAHDSSCNIFFTNTGIILYSVGQIKYS